jgi:PleD family two-component response regulator
VQIQEVGAVPLAPIGGGQESILVVEDDALVRAYVVAQLRSLGYNALTAKNATEALAITTVMRRSTCCSPTSSCRAP